MMRRERSRIGEHSGWRSQCVALGLMSFLVAAVLAPQPARADCYQCLSEGNERACCKVNDPSPTSDCRNKSDDPNDTRDDYKAHVCRMLEGICMMFNKCNDNSWGDGGLLPTLGGSCDYDSSGFCDPSCNSCNWPSDPAWY